MLWYFAAFQAVLTIDYSSGSRAVEINKTFREKTASMICNGHEQFLTVLFGLEHLPVAARGLSSIVRSSVMNRYSFV